MLNIFVILKNDFQYIKIHCTHYLSNNLKNNTLKKTNLCLYSEYK